MRSWPRPSPDSPLGRSPGYTRLPRPPGSAQPKHFARPDRERNGLAGRVRDEREARLDTKPARFAGPEMKCSAVGGGDGRDDREPETEPVAVAGSILGEALE